MKRTVYTGLLCSAAMFAAWSAPVTAPVITSELPDFHAMAATSRHTQRLGKSDLLGHVWIADFFFTRCGKLCPLMSGQMRQLQSRLSPDVLLVSFTIDPDEDSLKALRLYARHFDADPERWFFLRMPKSRLAELMAASFRMITVNRAADAKKSSESALSHSSRFVLVDARGRVRAVYDGLDKDSLTFIVTAAEMLRKEGKP